MLYTTLFRRAIAVHLTSNTIRGVSSISQFPSAMASHPQSFSLDKSIFNETLYSRLRDFWFADVADHHRAPTFEKQQKWFGVGQTPEQKAAFDQECDGSFGHALEALAPEKIMLPPWEGWSKEISNAARIAAPLFKEVKEIQQEDAKKGSQTLLSLIILLDQMPRNIYRDPAGLRLVYRHYDRLAFSLLQSSMTLTPNPIDHEWIKGRPVFGSWFLIPLMHSEHMESHQMYLDRTKKVRAEMVELGDEDAVAHMDMNIDFEIKHQEPLKRFRRYPHRNQALGRKNTVEEEEYLKSAETFGVKQHETNEKSEL